MKCSKKPIPAHQDIVKFMSNMAISDEMMIQSDGFSKGSFRKAPQ